MNALPAWKAPQLALGRLGVLELREEDPAQPTLPRPGEDRLGPLAVRGVEAMKDGRGWRITVQPLAPGTAVIPPLDLGDGRHAPELRLTIPRTVAYGTPWVGVGGGRQDLLPYLDFPWAWATVLVLPLAALGWFLARSSRRQAPARQRRAAQRLFASRWPPARGDRAALDAAHGAGRDLLAARFGDEARSWGPVAFQARGLEVWGEWVRSLDAARFALAEPPFPLLEALLAALEGR
jgi:hypothetical protein